MNEKENHLPNLSDKERAHALELAMKARKCRAVLKARMKSGELAFTDALNEEDAKRIEVVSLLKCVPGIGASKAEAIRRLVKIPLGRRVSGLGIRPTVPIGDELLDSISTSAVECFRPPPVIFITPILKYRELGYTVLDDVPSHRPHLLEKLRGGGNHGD